MNTTGIQYSTRRHRRLTPPGPEGAIFQPHTPAQLGRGRRPRAWLRAGLGVPGAPGGTGPGAAAGCAAATAAAVALAPHSAAASGRRGLWLLSPVEAVALRGRTEAARRREAPLRPRLVPARSPPRCLPLCDGLCPPAGAGCSGLGRPLRPRTLPVHPGRGPPQGR